MIRSAYLDASGIRTRYLETGAGPSTIVLIHAGAFSGGLVCHNALAWERNIAVLGAGFRVLAFDTLGQGRTGQPARDEDGTFDAVVDHARAVLATRGIERAHLVGHDEGGMIAVRLAFDTPQLAASCTVVDSPTVAPSGDGIPNPLLAAPLHPLLSRQGQRWVLDRQSHNPEHVTVGEFLNEAVAIAGSDGFAERRASFAPGGAHDTRWRRSLARLKADNFARFRDHGFPVPILFLNGNDDPMLSPPHVQQWSGNPDVLTAASYARQMFDLIAPKQRTTQMRLINRTGYWPFREAPEAFNAAVGGFARAINAAAS